MIGIAKVIGRLIAVLVDAGIVDREKAVWILEPLKDGAESEDTVSHKKDSHKEWWDSCYIKEVKPNETIP